MNRVFKLLLKSLAISTITTIITFFLFNIFNTVEIMLQSLLSKQRIIVFTSFLLPSFFTGFFARNIDLRNKELLLKYFIRVMFFSVSIQLTIGLFISGNIYFMPYNTDMNANYVFLISYIELLISFLFACVTFVFKTKKENTLKYSFKKLITVWLISILLYGILLFLEKNFEFKFVITIILGALLHSLLLLLQNKKGVKLISILIISIMGIPFLMTVLNAYITDGIEKLNYYYFHHFYKLLITYCILITILNHFYTLYSVFIEEESRFKKRRLQSKAKYQQLKNQLRPHFLFNNISVLTSLIEESPQKAVVFSKKLSSIYKYFLKHEKKDTVLLEDELLFLENYLQLLETRFEKGFSYSVSVTAQYMKKSIITTSLQQLVENVIKHNEIDEEMPVVINISVEKEYLVVKNNIKPKIITKNREGKGLINIIERYSFFSNEKVIVNKNENIFLVKLPLLTV